MWHNQPTIPPWPPTGHYAAHQQTGAPYRFGYSLVMLDSANQVRSFQAELAAWCYRQRSDHAGHAAGRS